MRVMMRLPFHDNPLAYIPKHAIVSINNWNITPLIMGPGVCDNINAVSEADCKTCLGTGSCSHGKTPEEYESLKKKHGCM